MLGFILICCALGLFFYLMNKAGNAVPSKADQDFEDNFLNGASEHDIDDF